jgi:hypothetical protein
MDNLQALEKLAKDAKLAKQAIVKLKNADISPRRVNWEDRYARLYENYKSLKANEREMDDHVAEFIEEMAAAFDR